MLYLAFQNARRTRQAPFSLISQHGSDAHIVYSTNKGGFWAPASGNIATPMFSDHKFGGPAFINFGKNNANARDELLTWRLHKDFSPDDGTDLLVLDAPEPWGPFSLVHHEAYWQGQEFNPYSRLNLLRVGGPSKSPMPVRRA